MITLIPPLSKSDAQRALVLAHITGHSLTLPEESLPLDVIRLRDGLQKLPTGEIDCGDGGAPFRFLLTQAALTANARVTLRGSDRLAERPHAPLLDALRRGVPGLTISEGNPWPLTIEAPASFEMVKGFEVSGDVSSQFASSLMLGAAALVHRTNKPYAVRLTGPLTSHGYLDLTRHWLARTGFGVDGLTVVSYRPVERWPDVPGDWSSIGYLLLLAWKFGGQVTRVDFDAMHPDKAIVGVLNRAGLICTPDGRCTGRLRTGLTASARECPDSIPTLGALACLAPGDSRFTDVAVLRHKESDRLAGIVELVTAVGGSAEVANDTLTIHPPAVIRPCAYDSRDDHRLAMSAMTLSRLAGVTIAVNNSQCVTKSFPGFVQQLDRIASL